MSLTDFTFTRAQLQDMPEKRRRDAIRNVVTSFIFEITSTASSGKMSYMIDLQKLNINNNSKYHKDQKQYIPTIEDLLEGFKAAFPDSKVEYTTMWVEVSPGHKHEKTGILIDWS